METRVLNIEGMHCQHCVMALKKSFEMVEGVEGAEVEVGRASVVLDESRVSDSGLSEAVERAGFKVRDY